MRRLWPGMKRILIAIGRWVLEEIVDVGLQALIHYMRARVKVFRWRLRNRARAAWRKRWLEGRIERWNRAIRWLTRNAKRFTTRALDWLQRKAQEIPWHSRLESSTWQRRALHNCRG